MSSHPKRRERKEEDTVNMSKESKDNLFALGARDAKELFDAWVRAQPC
jgi:hypothetical protein